MVERQPSKLHTGVRFPLPAPVTIGIARSQDNRSYGCRVLPGGEKAILLRDVFSARRRLAGVVVPTPLRHSAWLSDVAGVPVHLKLENLQLTGSFKFRGAYNCLSWARENGIERIFAASAGNHGLGVAEAARRLALETTVCIPTTASPAKKRKLRAYNVGVIEHGDDCDITESYARRLAREKKAFYVSPYNNPEVVAGQGTVALEMLEDVPDLTTLVVAVGGGGLIAGMAVAAKTVNPAIRVVGVVAANSPVMMECVKAGCIKPVFVDKTIADGIAGNIEADSITFPIVRELVDQWVAVPEADIRSTIFEFLDNEGMVVEGSAGASIAAVARKLVEFAPYEKVGVVVCGGNIDRHIWHDICFDHLQVAAGA